MDSLGITSFDLLVLAVVVLSGLYGLSRGFTHEVLSLAAWVGAVFATLYALPLVRPILQDFLEPDSFADIIAVILLGVVSLILFKLLAGVIGRAVRQSGAGPLDRSLGALFGVLRGFFIICAIYALTLWLVPQKSLPDWVLEARSRPIVEYGASLLASVTPAEIIDALNGNGERTLDRTMMDGLKNPIPTSPPGDRRRDDGYQDQEREDLERLIERHI